MFADQVGEIGGVTRRWTRSPIVGRSKQAMKSRFIKKLEAEAGVRGVIKPDPCSKVLASHSRSPANCRQWQRTGPWFYDQSVPCIGALYDKGLKVSGQISLSNRPANGTRQGFES
jgi:hypothetical protein